MVLSSWHMEICHKDTGYRVYMVKHGWFICNVFLFTVVSHSGRRKTQDSASVQSPALPVPHVLVTVSYFPFIFRGHSLLCSSLEGWISNPTQLRYKNSTSQEVSPSLDFVCLSHVLKAASEVMPVQPCATCSSCCPPREGR